VVAVFLRRAAPDAPVVVLPSDDLVSRLAAVTEANPFFSDEVVRLLVSHGRVEPTTLPPRRRAPTPASRCSPAPKTAASCPRASGARTPDSTPAARASTRSTCCPATRTWTSSSRATPRATGSPGSWLR
jgi:hypothetical protein